MKTARHRGFTMLEVLMALAIVSMLLVALNTFIFSMGELWGRNTDVRLFDQHVRNVTRFLEQELRRAALPPSVEAGTQAIAPKEVKPRNGFTDYYLTFELPQGCRLFTWPERPLPDVVCSLVVREREGLILLWHSKLETKFEDDPPRETVVTPLVTAMAYDYYDTDFKRWKTETTLRKNNAGEYETPGRLRLTFTYGNQKRETLVAVPDSTEGLPQY